MALGLSVLALPVLAESETTQELKDVERRIQDAQQTAQSIASQTSGALGEMDALDRSIAARERRLTRLAESSRAAGKRLDEAARSLRALDAALPKLTAQLATRARGLYRLTRRGLGPVVFQAPRDWSDATRYRRGLGAVVERDHALLREVRRNRVAAEDARRRAAVESAALASERRESEKELALQQAERASKQKLIASLRDRGEQQTRLIGELEASAERLRDLIEREEASKASRFEASPEMQNAKMRPPLAASVAAVSAARSGVEIRAAAGTAVTAVKAGRVVFAGWFTGYGQMVIVEHGERLYSIYGYASELLVERGVAVDAGQAIAKVGATGPASAPSLYFEIRDRGSPRDPAAYIPSLARK